MNAYELADALKFHFENEDESWLHPTISKSANMLRQQADRIAELSKNVDELEEDLLKATQTNAEPVAWMSPDGKVSITEGKLFHIPLYTTPQTKPLTDEEILPIYTKSSTYDSESGLFVDIYGFARAIEERHGIK